MSEPSGAAPQQPAAPGPHGGGAPQSPGAYPAQPAPPAYYYPPTNVLAIVAFVLAFVVSIGAVVCGHIALSQIKRTGERGHGLALAGVIIGYVGCAMWLVGILLWILVAVLGLVLTAATSAGVTAA